MIKVLYLSLGHQPGMENAFRQVGVSLRVFDFTSIKNKEQVSKHFLDMVRDFQPHLIHMQLQFTGALSVQTIHQARKICPHAVITNWTGDVRDKPVQGFADLSPALDYSLISSTGQLQAYHDIGCRNILYWQTGFDVGFNFPTYNSEFQYDVSFIANNYGSAFPDGKLRNSVAMLLRKEFGSRFGLFGSGFSPAAPSIEPRDGNAVYNKSVCALSISNFNNVSHYFSDRLLYCVASGRPTISWYFPGIESYFVEGSEILVARTTKDIPELVRYCMANPEIASQIGINGHRRALREHTFTSRVIELLDMTGLLNQV
jgi:hypothetical protein